MKLVVLTKKRVIIFCEPFEANLFSFILLLEKPTSISSNANGQSESDAAALPDSSDTKEAISSSKCDSDAKASVVESSSVNGESSVPEGSLDIKSDVSSSSNVQENGSKKGTHFLSNVCCSFE